MEHKSSVSTSQDNGEFAAKTRVEQMREIQDEGLELFKMKNRDYGDAFATYGSIGVIVRMGDKIHRLLSITNNGITMVNNESVYDTLLDLHNYSAMALMLLKEKETRQKDNVKSLFNVETQEIEHHTIEFTNYAY
jgi:Nucleotide modification associated domain 1